jgi:hypothetical protein
VASINPEQVDRSKRKGVFRYLDIAAVNGTDGSIPPERLKRLDWRDAPSRAQRRVRQGDVLVSTVRPYLRGGAWADDLLDGVVASTGFAVIRADEAAISHAFLWAVVRSDAFVRHLVTRQSGSNYPAVRPTDVADYTFALPPHDQQAAIVRVMEAADEAARATSAHVAQSERLAMSMRADAMRSSDAQNELLERVAEVTLGRQRAPQHVSGEHLLPYIRAANVKDGRLVLDDVLRMNFTPSEQAKYSLRPQDILVTEGCGSRDQIGASAKWAVELPRIVFSEDAATTPCAAGCLRPRIPLPVGSVGI